MKTSKVAALFLVLSLLVLVAGCDSVSEGDKYTGFIVQDGQPLSTKIYFSDAQEMYLAAEDLGLDDVNDLQEAAQKVIGALIAGPKDSSLFPTIPSGTKLLKVEVDGKGLAAVDFSAELKDNHPGGSSGETMTVYSIVNSLAELEGIDRVQILVEGQVIETLAGHISLDEPLEPDPGLIKSK